MIASNRRRGLAGDEDPTPTGGQRAPALGAPDSERRMGGDREADAHPCASSRAVRLVSGGYAGSQAPRSGPCSGPALWTRDGVVDGTSGARGLWTLGSVWVGGKVLSRDRVTVSLPTCCGRDCPPDAGVGGVGWGGGGSVRGGGEGEWEL